MGFTLKQYEGKHPEIRQDIRQLRKSSWLLDNIQFDDGAYQFSNMRNWVYVYDLLTTGSIAQTRQPGTEYTAQEYRDDPSHGRTQDSLRRERRGRQDSSYSLRRCITAEAGNSCHRSHVRRLLHQW